MNNLTDDIKIKEEPIESQEEQQIDLSSSNIKPESPILTTNTSKSKETKKTYRKNFFISLVNKIFFFFYIC